MRGDGRERGYPDVVFEGRVQRAKVVLQFQDSLPCPPHTGYQAAIASQLHPHQITPKPSKTINETKYNVDGY